MYGIPYTDIDYGKYGMLHRKRTRLWNNVFNWRPRPLCKKDCDSMVGNRHKATAQRMPIGEKQDMGDQPLFDQFDLYVIPSALIYEICNGILSFMPSYGEQADCFPVAR